MVFTMFLAGHRFKNAGTKYTCLHFNINILQVQRPIRRHFFLPIHPGRTNTGIGMTEEVQKHMFDKFYQAEGSRSMEGNGLGLALVKKILSLCDGTIKVTSTPDLGSSFTVRLPVNL